MMDIPGMTMSGGNNPMIVTEDGKAIAPTLVDFLTDRPFHLDLLAGNWLVEAALAQSADGLLAEPVIVRDGDAGRLIPLYQADAQPDPKGAVAAEIIAWLMGSELAPTQVALTGAGATVAHTPVKFTVSLLDGADVLTPSAADVTVDLASDATNGRFDTLWGGDYDGTVTSVKIPAGETSATVYYKDTSAGTVTLSASDAAATLTGSDLTLNVFPYVAVDPGEVLIYTGNVGWITKEAADTQADICVTALTDAGITATKIATGEPADWDAVATWVESHTNNDTLDVLVLYGFFPPTIYAAGNTETDGSKAELFIESDDGDVIINHADWMFYVSNPTNNGVEGLQNMMDNPDIVLWYDDTPMSVTPAGVSIAPTLTDFLSDRPIPVGLLRDNWFVEAALAENADGTLAEPVIVREGNLGRLIPVYQTNSQDDDPKGAVAAEIIIWLEENATGEIGPTLVRGDANSDGDLNLTDGIRILDFLFKGGPALECEDAGDTDDNGTLEITDAIRLFGYLFLGGDNPPPAVPGPSSVNYPPEDCGFDETEDDLGCEVQAVKCGGTGPG
jgi:hypothetical protein